ncbi:MAG: helix-turn-helix domain-containing protein, partial [Bdellovibrio bacteriovorus]
PVASDQTPPARPTASLHQREADYISGLLQDYGGNRRRVAELLGISERTLYRKLARARVRPD